MSRSMFDLTTTRTPEQVMAIAQQYLVAEGFKMITRKGEQLYKKGNGIVTVPQFIKITVNDGNVHIEAFLASFALIPGIYLGEMSLEGGWGMAPKEMLRRRISTLLALLSSNA